MFVDGCPSLDLSAQSFIPPSGPFREKYLSSVL